MTPVGLGIGGAGDEQAMKPIRERGGALNDLLERLLNKGVVIDLDLVIGVAGIPLIGVSLRAAVAAIETMIEYGFMQAWDEDTRRYAERELQRKKLDYAPGEAAILEMFGSHWYADRIYRAWRPGRLYLTDRRLILYRKSPAEVLFETPLSSICGMAIAESVHFNGRVTPLLHLALDSEEQVSIYAEDLPALEAALHDRLQDLDVPLTQTVNACERDADITQAFPDHRLLADGRMWREAPGGVADEAATWQAGWLYLTSEGLVWWSESERRAAVRIPAADIIGVGVEERDLGPLLGERSVLGVRYRERGRQKTVLFGGRGPEEWRRGIRRLVVDYDGGGLAVIDVDEGNLKQGLLGLVIALVEIIEDALSTQAFRRVENGSLTEAEMERLGEALSDLHVALAQIKEEHGVTDAVAQVRDGLDELVDEVVDRMINPERWREEVARAEAE